MIENFNRTYHSNKAPFGFYVHAAWFDVNPINYPAYLKFIDYLQTLRDVYLVRKFLSQYTIFMNKQINFFYFILGQR